MNFLWRQIEVLGEDIEDVFINHESKFIRNDIEFVLRFKQFLNCLNTNETLVSSGIDTFGIQNRRCNDGSEIRHVHS